jgi:hypothetical protein
VREQASDKGHLVISSKKNIENDINKVDEQT